MRPSNDFKTKAYFHLASDQELPFAPADRDGITGFSQPAFAPSMMHAEP
jgi:hypothetical protein